MPYRIGLDRGHGGTDPGAVKHVREVDVNTIVVKQLEEMLMADSNYTSVLICPYDKGMTITERANKANAERLDLLISNHFNAGGGDGWEVYPEVPRAQGHARYKLHFDSLAFSRRLAGLMQDIQQLRGNSGVQYKYAGPDSYFGIVRLLNCPAVLVENAFVDNLTDISDFDTPPELLRLAARQYLAICGHFATTPLFDKNGKRLQTPPVTPPPATATPKYRVMVEKASFTTAEEALALSKKENGIVIVS